MNMEETITDRLKQIISYYGGNQAQFANKLGISASNLAQILKGNRPLGKNMQRLIVQLGINRDWLLFGEGNMLLKKYEIDEIEQISEEEARRVLEDVKNGRVRAVPLFNLDVRGGLDGNVEPPSESVIAYVPWANAHDGDFAVEVSGMSMLPVIPPGSRVLLRRVEGWQTYLEMSMLYTLELNDDRRLLKELHKSEQGDDYFTVHSYNPRTPDQDIPKSFVRRVYKVVGIMTNYGF